MNSNELPRGLLLVGLILVSLLAAGAVSGVVGAQDTTADETGNNTTAMEGTQMDGTEMTNETTGAVDGTPMANATGTPMANATGSVSLTAEPDSAGATANHTVNITVGSEAAGNLTGVALNYSESNASVSAAVATVRSVTLSGESIINNTTQIARNGALNFTFNLSEVGTVEAGDELSMVYGQVGNPPEAGNYTVDVQINPGTEPTNLTAPLNISESEMTTTTALVPTNDTATTGADMDGNETTGMDMNDTATTGMDMDGTETTAMDGTETTAEETPTEEDTPTEAGAETTTTTGNGPGFTAFAALVAVLAAALLATRRN